MEIVTVRKRKDELDYARGIGMLLVVFAHLYTRNDSVILRFIGSFDMPLFFLFQGFYLGLTATC